MFFLCMQEYFWLATSTSGNLCQATSTSGKFYVGIFQRVVLLAIAVRQLVLLASNYYSFGGNLLKPGNLYFRPTTDQRPVAEELKYSHNRARRH